MKKLMRSASVSVGALCAATMLVACVGNVGPIDPTDHSIDGTWRTATIATQTPPSAPKNCQPDGATIPVEGDDDVECSANDVMTFRSDGTWTNNLVPPMVGTWVAYGGTVTITLSGGETNTMGYSVNGNVLTLTKTQGSTTAVSTSQKQ
jgi:hypothetical protein